MCTPYYLYLLHSGLTSGRRLCWRSDHMLWKEQNMWQRLCPRSTMSPIPLRICVHPYQSATRVPVGAMVLYTVYKVSYVTSAGSARSYIGYTGNVSARRAWHEKQPPAWMKPRKGAVLEFVCLETGIQTKECARAAEALHAARAISKDPLLVRGGPWVKAHAGRGRAG